MSQNKRFNCRNSREVWTWHVNKPPAHGKHLWSEPSLRIGKQHFPKLFPAYRSPTVLWERLPHLQVWEHQDQRCSPQNFCFSLLFYVSFFLQKNNTETKSTVWRMNAFSSVITAAIGTYGNSKQAPFWFMFDISFNWIFARKLVSLLRNGPPIMQRGGGIECLNSVSFSSDTSGMNNSFVHKFACLAATDINCQGILEQKKWHVKANLSFS